MTPQKKRVLSATGSAAGVAGLVGSGAHVGQYAALGFLDTKLNQVLRAGKEFVPDGIQAVLGTLNRIAFSVYRHGYITLILILGCGGLAWYLRRAPRVTPVVFIGAFAVVVLLILPAFTLLDLLHEPPDPARVPATRFARAFLMPIVEGVRFSRVRPPGSVSWDPTAIRSALSARYVIIVASTLYLFLLAQIALPDHKGMRRAANALVLVAVVGASYYWGAIEEDTSYYRTVAKKGHAQHDEHAAFLIATVGNTCSVYSFEYGNEQLDEQFTDTDPRKDDILQTRLLQP